MIFKIIPNSQTPKVIEVHRPLEGLLKYDYKMLEKFLYFAIRQYECAGLAANQVEVGTKKKRERIMEPFFAMRKGLSWELILHPRIHRYSGKKEKKTESCLTWLGKEMVVSRWPRIKVTYYTIKGEIIEEELTGHEAQVFQHEYDHLLGTIEEMVAPPSKP